MVKSGLEANTYYVLRMFLFTELSPEGLLSNEVTFATLEGKVLKTAEYAHDLDYRLPIIAKQLQ